MRRFFNNMGNFTNLFKKIFQHRYKVLYRTVFVDDKAIRLDAKEMVNLVLSPKYYWVKLEELPVKYAFQVSDYAPALFEGYIPEGSYSYKVIKRNGKFLIFAYDTKSIIESLEKLGVRTSQIHKVYFAQTEFEKSAKPIKIDDLNALVTRNGKVIKIPLNLIDKYVAVGEELKIASLSANTIKLGKFNRFYEKSGIFAKIMYVLIFLITLFLGELIYLSTIANNQNAQREDIVKRYSLPATQMQLKALIKQYDNINKKQSQIRDKIGYIFKFQLLEGEYFKNIETNVQGLSLVLHVSGKNRVNTAIDYLKKSFVVDDFREDGLDIKIKMQYE